MADRLNVSILMKLIDGITGPLKAINGRLSEAGKAFSHFQEKAEHAFDVAAKMKLANEGVSELAHSMRELTEAPIEKAMGFEVAVTRIGASSGLSQEQTGKLGESITKLAVGSEFAATDVAQSFMAMKRSGMSVDETIAQMPKVMTFAEAHMLSLGDATGMVGGIMKGFKIAAGETGHATDVLTVAAKAGGIPISEFTDGLGRISPIARGMGVSLESAAATMSLLGQAGLTGEAGAGALSAIMTKLASPRGAKRRNQVLSYLGVSAVDAKKNLKDVPTLLGEIASKTSKMGNVEKGKVLGALFGPEAATSMNALFKSMKPGAVDALRDALIKADGPTEAIAQTMNQTAEGASKRFHAAMENLGTVIGATFLPAASAFLEKLTAIINGLIGFAQNHSTLTKVLGASFMAITSIVSALAGLLSVLVTYQTLKGFTFLTQGYAAFTAALTRGLPALLATAGTVAVWTAGIGALVLVVVELVKHWKELNLLEGFKGIMQSISGEGVGSTLKQLFDPTALMQDLGFGGNKPTANAGGKNSSEHKVTVELGHGLKAGTIDSKGSPNASLDVYSGLASYAP